MPEKHIIPVCSYCLKDFPAVDTAIKAAMKKYGVNGELVFSHGYCLRHYEEMLKQFGMDDEKIKASLEKAKDNKVPDLKQRPDVVNLWSKSIFTQEQLQSVQQNQQQVNESLISRFRTLAGIRG